MIHTKLISEEWGKMWIKEVIKRLIMTRLLYNERFRLDLNDCRHIYI